MVNSGNAEYIPQKKIDGFLVLFYLPLFFDPGKGMTSYFLPHFSQSALRLPAFSGCSLDKSDCSTGSLFRSKSFHGWRWATSFQPS